METAEIHEISTKLQDDEGIEANRQQLSRRLENSPVQHSRLAVQYRNGQINSYGFISEELTTWSSKQGEKATKGELIAILREIGCSKAAEKLLKGVFMAQRIVTDAGEGEIQVQQRQATSNISSPIYGETSQTSKVPRSEEEIVRIASLQGQQKRNNDALIQARSRLQSVHENRYSYTRVESYTEKKNHRVLGVKIPLQHDAQRVVFDEGKFDAALNQAQGEVNLWEERVRVTEAELNTVAAKNNNGT